MQHCETQRHEWVDEIELVHHGTFRPSQPSATRARADTTTTNSFSFKGRGMAVAFIERRAAEDGVRRIRTIQIGGKIRAVLCRVHVDDVLY